MAYWQRYKKNLKIRRCVSSICNILGWLAGNWARKGKYHQHRKLRGFTYALWKLFQAQRCRWHRRATDGVAGMWAQVLPLSSSLQPRRGCIRGRKKVKPKCSSSSFAVLKRDALKGEFCPSSLWNCPLFFLWALMSSEMVIDGNHEGTPHSSKLLL